MSSAVKWISLAASVWIFGWATNALAWAPGGETTRIEQFWTWQDDSTFATVRLESGYCCWFNTNGSNGKQFFATIYSAL